MKELLYHVKGMLNEIKTEPVIFEREFFPEFDLSSEPVKVEKIEEGLYSIEGSRVERMLGYTNLETEKGFAFFQRFLRENNIIDELENLGIQEGDTVQIYDLHFDYYK